MQVEATEYTRQDGMKAIKLSSGSWVIRKVCGPTWFYSDLLSKWAILHQIPSLNDVGMSFDRAMELLNTLPELT